MRHSIFVSIVIGFFSFLAFASAQAQWIRIDSSFWANTGGANCFAMSGTTLFAGGSPSYSLSGTLLIGGVFASNDNGSSWTTVANGLSSQHSVYALFTLGANTPSPMVFAGTSDSGIFLTTNNGASWTKTNAGLTTLYVTSLAALGENTSTPMLFAGTYGGVFLSTNFGSTWTAVNNGFSQGTQVTSLATIGTNIFAGTQLGVVYASTDNGSTWTGDFNGIPQFTPIVGLATIGTNLFAGTSGAGVFLSTDNAASWTAVNAGLTNLSPNGLTSIGSDLITGTYGAGIFLSSNNGATWAAINSTSNDFYMDCFAVSGPYLVGGAPSGAWRRTLSEVIAGELASDTATVQLYSSGSSTVTLSGDSGKARPHRIDFVNASNTTLTVIVASLTASNSHFIISQISPGIPDSIRPGEKFSVILNFTGDQLGTIFLDTLVLTIDPNELITSYDVYLNGNSFSSSSDVTQSLPAPSADLGISPNPTFSSTTLHYFLTEESPVNVVVYDALGRMVASPILGEIESAGAHDLTYDTKELTPGIYSCRLSTGQTELFAKMAVVR